MAKTSHPPFPAVQTVLTTLGENIRLARLRRRLTAELVAKRAGITRNTLRSIETGAATASMGAYAAVLNALGLVEDLAVVGQDDKLGRRLQDAGISVRRRVRRRSKKPSVGGGDTK